MRGFAMKHGHNKCLLRRRNANAPCEARGRNCFSRSIGDGRDVKRCSMCKPGRHHRDGGKKALKKVQGYNGYCRDAWLEIRHDARAAEKGLAPELLVDLHSAPVQRRRVKASAEIAERAPDYLPLEGADVPPPPPPVPAALFVVGSCGCGCRARGYKGASRKHAHRLGVPQTPPATTVETAAVAADVQKRIPEVTDVSEPVGSADDMSWILLL